jgi:hypothetical protein
VSCVGGAAAPTAERKEVIDKLAQYVARYETFTPPATTTLEACSAAFGSPMIGLLARGLD